MNEYGIKVLNNYPFSFYFSLLSKETKAPNIENCNMNVSWGMKYLLGEIDQKCQDTAEKTRFKSILLDSKPGRSKWNNPNRIGQDELYQGLEKVLLDLKSYTVNS